MPRVRIVFFFISRGCGGRPDLQEEDVLPDREKCFKLSPRDLGPSPLNAGQVWHLDLCVTLGVLLAPLLSYKVDKFRDIKGYLYRSRNTVYFRGFPL